MTAHPRIVVVGTGAVGGYYGALLARAGREVCFLARSDHAELARSGLRVDSVNGDFVLATLSAHHAAETVAPCEIAIVALKTTSNAALPSILPRVLAPGGSVILLQNGLGEEEKVAELPGVGSVMAGLAFVCVSKVGPGHIRHFDYGAVRLAEYTRRGAAGITPALAAVGAELEAAGVPVTLEPDWLAARWRKLVWNLPYNGLSVVLRADTGALMASPPARALIAAMMREVAAASAAEHRAIPDAFIEQMLTMTDAMRPYLPSMRLDFDAGRELELAAMYAVPVRRARAAGAPMPRVEALLAELEFLVAARDEVRRSSNQVDC
ncbi:MAG: putative 2-dehydropantoate 2-reductase [Polyangiaceae bacterium]|nr:putative 2-dehydropantoate 2-reductase [Polyangiaceae bacterium]